MVGLDREPVVAGTFYSANADTLKHQLGSFFGMCEILEHDNISAIIVPHAGYVYSGLVAACAYAQINKAKQFDNVFIIGSSHHVSFNGASVYNQGNYKTPLGICKVNIDLANHLIDSSKIISYKKAAHIEEHTIEVQLPFLQYYFENQFSIVPIIVGTHEKDVCKKIADVLAPYFNSRNLFVISTDFSHYPECENAKMVDGLTADSICKNNPDDLLKVLDENNQKGIGNLYTSLCGWSSVLVLLYLTNGQNFSYKKVKYLNSGQVFNENRSRVVGYQSLIVEREGEEVINLCARDKESLINICRKEIYDNFGRQWIGDTSLEVADSVKYWNSAFVSVYVSGELRGCLGQFDSKLKMEALLKELAVSSSSRDFRFQPVQKEELNDLKIEISLLTPMRKVDSINEIELGKHGVYVKKGLSSGTFLPQVADKTKWSKEDFLGHLARDKARIGWDGWKDAEIFIYEAIVFSDK